ncbi:cytochrome ubiquinol oxidase subunit II [Erythrobacter sp. 3-20A1M]|nr:cytochrome ubiquinol oxidase subunit II [Erythrobacter sp. 3-20A1M]
MMRKPPEPRLRSAVAGRLSSLTLFIALTGCAQVHSGGMLDPAGPVAQVQRDHFLIVVALVAIVIVPVFLALPWILWRYRLSRKSTDYKPDWDFDRRIEWVIWGVPVLVVAVLAAVLWINVHRIDPYRPLALQGVPQGAPPLPVQAVGLDWKWLFIYPEQGIATVDELVVPAGRDIAFDLTADGPMMSFYVPRLGGQIYAMAGMRTQLHLAADAPGGFRGLNTQYNGVDFHRQSFRVRALPPREFAAWAARARSAPPLDVARYAKLVEPSVTARPLVFGRVEPDLFAKVIGKYEGGSAPHHMAQAAR